MADQIRVNSLPSNTFRYLKVNDSVLDLSGLSLKKQKDNVNSELRKAFSQIKTGMGKEIDSLTDEYAKKELVQIKKDEEKTVKISDFESLNVFLFDIDNNSRLNIIFDCSNFNDDCLLGISTKFILKENSKVKLTVVQMLNSKKNFFFDVGAELSKEASFEFLSVVLGGKDSYIGCNIALKGDSSSFKSSTGYIVKAGQSLDMNYVSDQYSKKTKSNIDVSGVLGEKGSKTFRGTIDFKVGASGSTGAETENVLTIGEDIINKSVPLILCGEEDVEGQHGASIGSLSDEILYYMNSRGIDRNTAIKMASYANVMRTASQIEDKQLVEKIEKHIDKSFDGVKNGL